MVKKTLSMVLVMCMVFTTLIGTMVTDVSATYTSSESGNVYTFDTSTVVQTKMYNVGDWHLSNGTVSVKLGTVTDDNANMGMNFKKFVFSAGSLSGIADPGYTFSLRGEITNTARYGITEKYTQYSQGHAGTEVLSVAGIDAIVGPLDTDGDGTLDRSTGKVAKYTMYAYSGLKDGEPINFNMVRMADDYSAVFTVPANVLYSENGIPHKIDFIFYHQSAVETPVESGAKTANFAELYIDGLFYAEGNPATTSINNDGRFVFVSPNITFTPNENSVISWKKSELYICSSPSGRTSYKNVSDIANRSTTGTDVTAHERADINSLLFQEVKFSNGYGNMRSGFITGVDSTFAKDLEAAYTSDLGGDRIAKVKESIYNDPASIWNGEETNVSIVDKNGNVYTEGDTISGTFADYYIAVNGVYAKVEEKAVYYEVSSKKAVVNIDAVPAGTESLQVIVAAFDSGKLSKIKVSEPQVVGSANITFEITDGEFPTDAEQYKVFVFDSLTSAKPLVEHSEISVE